VTLLLRLVGVLNAAVWLGAAIFFTFAAAPAVFSRDLSPLGPFWPGIIAQVLLERYFRLHLICGTVALAHLLAEWVYLGRTWQRLSFAVLLGLMVVNLAGGLWLQPKLKALHLIKYGSTEDFKPAQWSDAERSRAAATFSRWHGVSQVLNLVMLGGLVFFFWRVTHPPDDTRFVNPAQFRGMGGGKPG
jgi:hypothetical protein